MGYYDDDDEDGYGSYYEYEDQVAAISFVGDAFSERSVTEVLYSAGLTPDRLPKYVGTMRDLVFTYGVDDEIYSSAEIRFIKTIDNVLVYPDFKKRLNRGDMVCRTVAAKINASGHDALRACISVEKIVDKALDGFNIFFFVTEEKVFIGCRIFDKKGERDCALSSPIEDEHSLEQVVDELSYLISSENFMHYYKQFRAVLVEGQSKDDDYENEVLRRRGMQYSYLESMRRIEDETGIDMSRERERYQQMFNEEPRESFNALLAEVKESLSFIKSNRVNMYEMIFEADEILRQAEETEVENERLALQAPDWINAPGEDQEAQELLDDPEEMIKLLKRRRGL